MCPVQSRLAKDVLRLKHWIAGDDGALLAYRFLRQGVSLELCKSSLNASYLIFSVIQAVSEALLGVLAGSSESSPSPLSSARVLMAASRAASSIFAGSRSPARFCAATTPWVSSPLGQEYSAQAACEARRRCAQDQGSPGEGVPGSETIMSSQLGGNLASATPVASTRWRITLIASRISWAVTRAVGSD